MNDSREQSYTEPCGEPIENVCDRQECLWSPRMSVVAENVCGLEGRFVAENASGRVSSDFANKADNAPLGAVASHSCQDKIEIFNENLDDPLVGGQVNPNDGSYSDTRYADDSGADLSTNLQVEDAHSSYTSAGQVVDAHSSHTSAGNNNSSASAGRHDGFHSDQRQSVSAIHRGRESNKCWFGRCGCRVERLFQAYVTHVGARAPLLSAMSFLLPVIILATCGVTFIDWSICTFMSFKGEGYDTAWFESANQDRWNDTRVNPFPQVVGRYGLSVGRSPFRAASLAKSDGESRQYVQFVLQIVYEVDADWDVFGSRGSSILRLIRLVEEHLRATSAWKSLCHTESEDIFRALCDPGLSLLSYKFMSVAGNGDRATLDGQSQEPVPTEIAELLASKHNLARVFFTPAHLKRKKTANMMTDRGYAYLSGQYDDKDLFRSIFVFSFYVGHATTSSEKLLRSLRKLKTEWKSFLKNGLLPGLEEVMVKVKRRSEENADSNNNDELPFRIWCAAEGLEQVEAEHIIIRDTLRSALIAVGITFGGSICLTKSIFLGPLGAVIVISCGLLAFSAVALVSPTLSILTLIAPMILLTFVSNFLWHIYRIWRSVLRATLIHRFQAGKKATLLHRFSAVFLIARADLCFWNLVVCLIFGIALISDSFQVQAMASIAAIWVSLVVLLGLTVFVPACDFENKYLAHTRISAHIPILQSKWRKRNYPETVDQLLPNDPKTMSEEPVCTKFNVMGTPVLVFAVAICAYFMRMGGGVGNLLPSDHNQVLGRERIAQFTSQSALMGSELWANPPPSEVPICGLLDFDSIPSGRPHDCSYFSCEVDRSTQNQGCNCFRKDVLSCDATGGVSSFVRRVVSRYRLDDTEALKAAKSAFSGKDAGIDENKVTELSEAAVRGRADHLSFMQSWETGETLLQKVLQVESKWSVERNTTSDDPGVCHWLDLCFCGAVGCKLPEEYNRDPGRSFANDAGDWDDPISEGSAPENTASTSEVVVVTGVVRPVTSMIWMPVYTNDISVTVAWAQGLRMVYNAISKLLRPGLEPHRGWEFDLTSVESQRALYLICRSLADEHWNYELQITEIYCFWNEFQKWLARRGQRFPVWVSPHAGSFLIGSGHADRTHFHRLALEFATETARLHFLWVQKVENGTDKVRGAYVSVKVDVPPGSTPSDVKEYRRKWDAFVLQNTDYVSPWHDSDLWWQGEASEEEALSLSSKDWESSIPMWWRRPVSGKLDPDFPEVVGVALFRRILVLVLLVLFPMLVMVCYQSRSWAAVVHLAMTNASTMAFLLIILTIGGPWIGPLGVGLIVVSSAKAVTYSMPLSSLLMKYRNSPLLAQRLLGAAVALAVNLFSDIFCGFPLLFCESPALCFCGWAYIFASCAAAAFSIGPMAVVIYSVVKARWRARRKRQADRRSARKSAMEMSRAPVADPAHDTTGADATSESDSFSAPNAANVSVGAENTDVTASASPSAIGKASEVMNQPNYMSGASFNSTRTHAL